MANFKFKKDKHRKLSKFYFGDIWTFKRSFKLDYLLKKEFKKALKNKTLF